MKSFTVAQTIVTLIAASSLWLAGCASLEQFSQSRKPQAEITGVRLDRLDLQQLGLILDLKVVNPNAVGLQLSKLNYDFLIEGNSLFKGMLEQGVQLAANSTRQLEIPVTVNPANLWETIRRLAQQDRFRLTLSSVASFAVPVLGDVQLPLQKTVELPVLHTPLVKVGGLKRKSLSLTRAELELSLQVANPNAFALLLNEFNYDFQVNNRPWATGHNTQSQRIESKQANEIRIPIALNFLEMGTAVYQMLSAKSPLDYHLAGQFDFGSSESFLKSLKLPLNYAGSTRLLE